MNQKAIKWLIAAAGFCCPQPLWMLSDRLTSVSELCLIEGGNDGKRLAYHMTDLCCHEPSFSNCKLSFSKSGMISGAVNPHVSKWAVRTGSFSISSLFSFKPTFSCDFFSTLSCAFFLVCTFLINKIGWRWIRLKQIWVGPIRADLRKKSQVPQR